MLHEATIFPGPHATAALAGLWVEIVYDSSFLADPVRPTLIVTSTAGGIYRQRLPAPVLGRAIWIGRIPPDAIKANLESTVPLRIKHVRRRGLAWRLSQAALRHPRHAAAATALLVLARPVRAGRRLARALTEHSLTQYANWAAPRRRLHEPHSLDAPSPEAIALRDQISVTLATGETLTPYALDTVATAFAADPTLFAVRGDSEIVTPTGLAAGFVSAWTPAQGPIFRRTGTSDAAPKQIRRILTRHPPRQAEFALPPAPPTDWPSVSIIVPTRDRLDLLKVCVHGVLSGTDYPDLTLLIADNDSAEAATLTFLRDLAAGDSRVHITPCPGTFNFSVICNRAAASADGEVLVFLNNDVAISDPAWLKALVAQAVATNNGAVGPTLIFPDGNIQHAGVAMGPSGTAGHILAGQPVESLAAIKGPRRLSAVTAACLAVQRDKFEAVGGFDEAFAVTYNDIDFCLRLRAKGWVCTWLPETHLTHHESASRGKTKPDLSSINRFHDRWEALIADDPHFHPAFSDAALDLALA